MKRTTTGTLALVLGVLLTGCSGPQEPSQAEPSSTAAPTTAAPTTAPTATGPTTPAPTAPATSPPTSAPRPDVGPQYVALGDSYAAAPGVPETSGADGCFRSNGNYAQAVAVAADLAILDATCSGATTATVLADQVPLITPQTELVTVGIGGNDSDLFTTLIRSCVALADTGSEGTPCTDAAAAEVDRILPVTAASVSDLFDRIAAAGPQARVVVVGYPELLPASGSCRDRLPLAPGDYPFVNQVIDGLSDLLETAAEDHDFDFVDLQGPSRGHDICSAEPWVNGHDVADDGTIPYHPFGVEQQAVARLVVDLL